MPWTAADAESHNKAANTPAKRSRWAAVANQILKQTGNDARAIKGANAAIANMSASAREYIAVNSLSGRYRTESHQGQEYIVVPLVALAEGVIQGVTAQEPELALASEFGRFPTSWNGRPVTIDHPTREVEGPDGEAIRVPVSASMDPDVQADFQVGTIFNTRLDRNKLRMEAWIDPVKMNRHSKGAAEMLRAIKRGEQIEVSTGLFANAEPAEGSRDGKEFGSVWRGVVPDHLALLTGDQKGACSVEDGCGLYANTLGHVGLHIHLQACKCGGACGCLSHHSKDTPMSAKNQARTMPPSASTNDDETTLGKKGKAKDNSNKTANAEVSDDQVPGGKNAKGKNQARVMDPDEDENRGTSEVLSGQGSCTDDGFDDMDGSEGNIGRDGGSPARRNQGAHDDDFAPPRPADVGGRDIWTANWSADTDNRGEPFTLARGGSPDSDPSEEIPNDGKKGKAKDNTRENKEDSEDQGSIKGGPTAKSARKSNARRTGDADEDVDGTENDSNGTDASEEDNPPPKGKKGAKNNQGAGYPSDTGGDPRNRDPYEFEDPSAAGVGTVKGMSAAQLNWRAFQLSLNAGNGKGLPGHKLMDNDVRESLQAGLDRGHSSDRDAAAYLHGFTPTHAVYSRYDTSEGRRNTYSRAYSIDPKSKDAIFDKTEKKVRLTTEITPLRGAPGGDRGNSDTAEGENVFMGNANRQTQETSMTANNAGGVSSPNTPAPRQLSMQEFLGTVPREYREIVTSGLKMHAAHKDGLIAKLKANKANRFTDEQLGGFNVEMLENLVALAVEPDPVFNYAGAGGGSSDAMRSQAFDRGLTTNAAPDDEFFAPPPPRLGIVANKETPSLKAPAV